MVAHNCMPYYWVAFSYTSLTPGRKIPWNHMTTNTRKLSSGWYSLLNRNHDAPSMRSSTFFTAEVRYSCGFPFSRALFVKSRTSFFYWGGKHPLTFTPIYPALIPRRIKAKKKKKTDVIIFEVIDEKNMRLTKQHEVDKTYRQPIKLNKAINKHTYN